MLRIWDTTTGELIRGFGEDSNYIFNRIEWPAQGGPIISLRSGLGNIGDTTIRVWNVRSGAVLAEFRGQDLSTGDSQP